MCLILEFGICKRLLLCSTTQWCTVISLETTEFWAAFLSKTQERGKGEGDFLPPVALRTRHISNYLIMKQIALFWIPGGIRLPLTTLQLR